jgi:ankyrin repeat protein
MRQGGRTPLHLAALRGNKEVAETLLKSRSVHVDARDENGMTPLHKAATQGHVGVAEVLITKLADVNARLKV